MLDLADYVSKHRECEITYCELTKATYYIHNCPYGCDAIHHYKAYNSTLLDAILRGYNADVYNLYCRSARSYLLARMLLHAGADAAVLKTFRSESYRYKERAWTNYVVSSENLPPNCCYSKKP